MLRRLIAASAPLAFGVLLTSGRGSSGDAETLDAAKANERRETIGDSLQFGRDHLGDKPKSHKRSGPPMR